MKCIRIAIDALLNQREVLFLSLLFFFFLIEETCVFVYIRM